METHFKTCIFFFFLVKVLSALRFTVAVIFRRQRRVNSKDNDPLEQSAHRKQAL